MRPGIYEQPHWMASPVRLFILVPALLWLRVTGPRYRENLAHDSTHAGPVGARSQRAHMEASAMDQRVVGEKASVSGGALSQNSLMQWPRSPR